MRGGRGMFSSVRGAALGTEGVEFYLESLEGGSGVRHELKYGYMTWFYEFNESLPRRIFQKGEFRWSANRNRK